MKAKRLLARAMTAPSGIRFSEAVTLAELFGFTLDRVKGSHHIFVHSKIPELVNLQDVRGMAKAYQVRQLLRLVERYDLELGEGK